jgi:hypothetical protein
MIATKTSVTSSSVLCRKNNAEIAILRIATHIARPIIRIPVSIGFTHLLRAGIAEPSFPANIRRQASTHQFVKQIVFKYNTFPSAVAFNILHKIGHRIVATADRNIPDFVSDFLKALFLPGAVARIRRDYNFPDEILEAVNLCWRSTNYGIQNRNDLGCRYITDSILLICFGIGLIPPVPGCFLIRFAHKQEICRFFLSRRSRACVVFHRLAANFGSFPF